MEIELGVFNFSASSSLRFAFSIQRYTLGLSSALIGQCSAKTVGHISNVDIVSLKSFQRCKCTHP